jgi:microcompartment protein CcmL/EutN
LQYTALGMIETRGFVGAIEAADAAAKAAEIHLLGIEKVTGGLVMIRFVGDTASVQAAVEAGSLAAARVGFLVSSQVIPRLDDQAVRMLGLHDPEPESSPGSGKSPAEGDVAPRRSDAEGVRGESYITWSVPDLRTLARSIPDFPVQGRDLNRMPKDRLIDELVRIQTQGKGHE